MTHELRRMNLYGVLGLYIPAFGRIVGRMQYDLFHAYTVDEHTLFVVSNLRRFALSRFDDEFPHCSEIMQALEQPEIAYLAACFTTSRRDAAATIPSWVPSMPKRFASSTGSANTKPASSRGWSAITSSLSMTAQKKDIHDPDVINEFATTRRRPAAPRLPVRADRCRRSRHRPETLELLESAAVP